MKGRVFFKSPNSTAKPSRLRDTTVRVCAALLIVAFFASAITACEKKKETNKNNATRNPGAAAIADKLTPTSFDEPIYEYKVVNSDVDYGVKRLNELAAEYKLSITAEDGWYKINAPKGVFFAFQKKLASLGKLDLYSKERRLPQASPDVEIWVKISAK